MFLCVIEWIIFFHLFQVGGLFAPLMFRDGILMCPDSFWVRGGVHVDVFTYIRPVADPAHWSLQPWVMAGSRPACGGRGEVPVAIVILLGGFIGVISLIFVVGVKHLGLQPFWPGAGSCFRVPGGRPRLTGPTLGTCQHAIHPSCFVGLYHSGAFLSQKNLVSKCGPQRLGQVAQGERRGGGQRFVPGIQWTCRNLWELCKHLLLYKGFYTCYDSHRET